MAALLLLSCLLLTFVYCGHCVSISYNLDEEKPNDTYIGNIKTDANLNIPTSDDSDVTFSFIRTEAQYEEFFAINKKQSTLFTSKRLDRETLCPYSATCQLGLEVIASGTKVSFYQKIFVTVHLIDINDHKPEFSVSNVSRDVSEGALVGTYILISDEGAVDNDYGILDVQSYRIEVTSGSPPPFTVDYQTSDGVTTAVKLILNQRLDRETKDSYNFKIIAEDGGSPKKKGTLDVSITVTDTNDNTPVFSASMYNMTINEDFPVDASFLNISATDDDLGLAGEVNYQLNPKQDDQKNLELFAIEKETGSLKVIASLIYERKENYTIAVEAFDKGQQPNKNKVNVYLHVRDVHNNPPRIIINLLPNNDFAAIPEDANLDTAVAHITVFDPDNGLNGIVECNSTSNKFKLQRFDVHEYKVVIKSPLNRESKAEHQVFVSCHDNGSPPLSSTAEFTVKVLDENDNKPVFTKQIYGVSIQENNDKGDFLLKVSANDFDAGKNADVTYSMSTVANYDFHIDSKSGEITVLSVLDREDSKKLTFTVFAKDDGSPSLTGSADVVITVTDDNDHFPQFTNENPIFTVPESAGLYTPFGIIQATDDDEGDNKKVSFSLYSEYPVPFTVLSNGTLQTTEKLDRENISTYSFKVIVTDHGKTPNINVTNVTVNIMDVNDNEPTFKFPNDNNKTITISFQTQPNTVIARISATDPDSQDNARVSYFFKEKTYSGMFQMNSLSGRITIVRPLTIHEAGRYTITITAQDGGTPPMISEQEIHIVVTTQSLGYVTSPQVTEDGRQYFLIVIAISCVTVVIAVVIILTICLIKRADRIRKKYVDSNKNENGDDKDKNSKKTVSFTSRMNNLDKFGSNTSNNEGGQLYQALNRNTLPIESSLSRFPDVALNNKELTDRNRNQMASLQLQQQLLETQNKNRRPVKITSQGISKKVECDDNSDLSAEVTTSDSGRGGSEDDLNTSTVLSYSMDFEQLKQSQGRNFSTFYQSSPRGREHAICTTTNCSNSYQQPHFNKNLTLSSDSFFNFENSAKGIFPKGISRNTSITSGHDDSTTTSGSYIIDDDDEYVDMVQPSKQCIV